MDRAIPPCIAMVLLALVPIGGGEVLTLSQTSMMDFSPTGYRGGIYFHVGEICVSCHTRFSKDKLYSSQLPFEVSDNAVLHIFPCSKPACHNTPPTKFASQGTSRWTLHMGICENCHPKWNSSYETIHNTHLNFSYLLIDRSGVECDICHARPLGFRSSVARVPPWPSGETEFTGTIVKPDWRGDCSYCHFTIKGAVRVHDVHEPVLLKACPICHSDFILKSPAMFNRIGMIYPFEEDKPTPIQDKIIQTVQTNKTILKPPKTPPPIQGETIPIISEFYLYFNGILEELLKIYKALV